MNQLISYHGGHSGQYCNHARDRLENIILRYIELGFARVGITEHIPPLNDQFCYPDEKEKGLTADDLQKQFQDYFKEIKHLQKKYASEIKIYAGMETETVTGYVDHVKKLITTHKPDYIVGSVHHIDDVCFDFSEKEYEKVLKACGSYTVMYEKYFDQQYEMLRELTPFVVGHFDLVRIYDPDYKNRLKIPAIEAKIERNLDLIKAKNLVMDFNLRPFLKGGSEPYITESIIKKAKSKGIRLVPGDDSHGVDEAGLNIDKAVQLLTDYGFDTQWPKPQILTKT